MARESNLVYHRLLGGSYGSIAGWTVGTLGGGVVGKGSRDAALLS